MAEICRPVILYNKQNPYSASCLPCNYVVFGTFDGMDILPPIILDKENGFSALLNDSLSVRDRGDQIESTFSSQLIFLFRHEDDKEPGGCIRESDFWQKESLFLFYVTMQISGKVKDYKSLRRMLESKINSWEEQNRTAVRVIGYMSLDNSSLTFFIKSMDYSDGLGIIHSLHKAENYLQYHCAKGGRGIDTVFVDYTYSICGCDPSLAEGLSDKKQIDAVSFSIIEREYNGADEMRKLLAKKLEKPLIDIRLSYLLGNDDAMLTVENVKWNKLLPCYQTKKNASNPEHDGLLMNTNPLYQKYTYGVSTQLIDETPEPLLDFSFDQKAAANYIKKKPGDSRRCDLLSSELERFRETAEALERNQVSLDFYKIIRRVLHSLVKFESLDFTIYVFVSCFEPLKMLVEELSRDVGKLEDEENRVYEFINGISLIMQCSEHSNRQFSQIPDFNMILHNMPVKLNAFYSAYMSYVTNVFNSLNAEYSKNYNYCFLVCPGLKEQTQVKIVFQNRPPENRLLLAEVPEKQLLNPGVLLVILIHEAAHYVGNDTRNRSNRYSCVQAMLVRSIVLYVATYQPLKDFITEENLKEFEERLSQDFISRARPYEKEPFYNYTEKMKCNFFQILSRLLQQKDPWQCLIKRDQKILYSDLLTKNQMNEACFNKINSFPRELDKLRQRLLAPGRGLSELNQILNDMIKEVYADLMSILTLHLTPFRYVRAIQCSLPSMSAWDCPIVIRLALVFRSMASESADDERGHIPFNFVWTKANLFELERHQELAGLYQALQTWVPFFSNEDTGVSEYQKIINSDSLVDGASEKLYNIFKNRLIWKNMIRYLIECRTLFEEKTLPSNGPQKAGYDYEKLRKLREGYEKLTEINDVEHSIIYIQDLIREYYDSIKQNPLD